MKISALFFALAFGLPSFSYAQIFVGSGGLLAPLTFGSAPELLAVEWASSKNALPGGGGTYASTGDVVAAVQTLGHGAVTSTVERITANSTYEAARHNTASGYLVSQSTSVGATLLKATLRNVSAQAFSHITMGYDFGVAVTPTNETLVGFQVFFSTNGLAGSWQRIPAFSTLSNPVPVSATLFLGRWLPNTDIYLLWADDNSDTGTDGGYTIDNFTVSSTVVTNVTLPLSITLTAPAHGTIVFNPVTATASAAGSIVVTNVRFFATNELAGIGMIATDVTESWSREFAGLIPGTYSFYARARNAAGDIYSATNTVRVREEFAEYTGGTYTQTFDSMGPTGTETPSGWYAGSTLPATTVDVTPGDGISNPVEAVHGWNHGTTGSGERALGTSPTAGERNMVLRLRNSSGSLLTSFTLQYDGEVWRNYTNATSGWLTNYYSTNLGATWIPTTFHFQQPVASVQPQTNLDGNLPGNRTANIGGTIFPAALIQTDAVIYFRWHDFNESGTDGALAIDDVSFIGTPPPPNDTCGGATLLYDGFSQSVDTRNATTNGDPRMFCSGNLDRGVWYMFSPLADGRITLNASAAFPVEVIAFTGNCPGTMNTTCWGNTVTLTVSAGVTYRFFIAGSSGNAGNINVNATVCEKPYNITISVDSVTNVLGGIRVTYRADYSGDLATSFAWSFDGNFQPDMTGRYPSYVFGLFDSFPDIVSVQIFNACSGPNGGLGGNPVTPPCGAICLSIGSPATHTTANGGSAASPLISACGELDAATKWFPLGEDPNSAGLAFLSISNSSPDTIITVYRGSIFSTASLVELDCATNGGSKRVARFETRPGGTNYYVAARSTNLSALNIRHGYELIPPTPSNDECANAVPMSNGLVYYANTLNANPNNDPVPPVACVPSFGRGVWYSYLATATGPVLLSTCDSDFDTALQVYSGTCAALVPVAGSCTNNNGPLCAGTRASLRFNAVQNTTYRILVGGANQAAGNLVISATPCAAPVFSALTTSVTLESNGVRVLYQAAFSNNAPHTYLWSFNDGVSNVTTSNRLSRLFGPFHPYPNSVTVSATNFCGSNSSTISLSTPCEPICLASALDTNRTHLGTNGSGTNGVSYTNSGGFPAAGTRWFRLSPLTNAAGVAFISSAGSAPGTRLAVYHTNSFASNALAFVTNRSGGGAQSRVEFETSAGTNYWLAVHTTNGGALQLTYGYQVRFASVALTNLNGGNRALDLLSMPLPSRQYRLRGGTNLSQHPTNWTALITTNFSNSISASTNILRFRDTNVPVLNQRFYQIERVP